MSGRSSLTARLLSELRTPDEVRDAVYLFAGDVAAKQTRFWLLLVLSAVIATAGVIGDSTATVIGAMISAPLAIPIQGIGVAIAYAREGRCCDRPRSCWPLPRVSSRSRRAFRCCCPS